MRRFATLAGVLRSSLSELQRAIKGVVVMSAELEAMYHSLLSNQARVSGRRSPSPSHPCMQRRLS